MIYHPDYFTYIVLDGPKAIEQFRADAKAEGVKIVGNGDMGILQFVSQDKVRGLGGFVPHMAFQAESVKNGKIVVKVDYNRYRSGKADFCLGGMKDFDIVAFEKQKEDEERQTKSISAGGAAIIVYDKGLYNNTEFWDWLKQEGFRRWNNRPGYYPNCPWVFININSKVYEPGMPGIKITQEFGNHAVTISEFKEIYSIFKKYEGKDVFHF